jgi:hypothetical protein
VSALTYPADTEWRFTSKGPRGTEKVGTLELWYELMMDPISDDYSSSETEARELFSLWLDAIREGQRWHPDLGAPHVSIGWYVAGEDSATFEGAPFAEDLYARQHASEDFLTFYTWPENADTGERLNWLRLPVQDKLWAGHGDKGGFITDVTGWKPSALQSAVDLRVFEAAGLSLGSLAP